MRINVYQGEITEETEVVRDGERYGVRIILNGQNGEHAITFWIPEDVEGTPDFGTMRWVFQRLDDRVADAHDLWAADRNNQSTSHNNTRSK